MAAYLALMELPRQTAEIFARLCRGHFVSANSSDPEQSDWYAVISQHEATLQAYFAPLGFTLEQGPGYYYLGRDEPRSSIEDKIERFSRLIERVSWLKHYEASLGPGHRLSIPTLSEALKQRPDLQRRLAKLPLKGNHPSDQERLLALLRTFERESFAEQIQDQPPTFRVLSSFHYLETLILAIGKN